MPHIRLHIALSLIGLLCALNNYAQTVENDTVCIDADGKTIPLSKSCASTMMMVTSSKPKEDNSSRIKPTSG